ncbi:MAG: mechanosensitive ion channel family protein [Oscillospiraceae bacterium]|nr:mechanosensitive ion channel family protein [Oscillospiraceae bacterium]
MAEQLEAGHEALEHTTGVLYELGEKLVKFMPTLLISVIVFLIGVLIARLLVGLLRHAMKRAKVNAAAISFGQSFARILLLVILLMICLSLLGVPAASVVTLLGAAGVTIGLALQGSLSNMAGGFILMLAKPFQAGDYIIADGQEGYVEAVTILYTKLTTRDNRSVYLPNSMVSSGAVVNLSQKGKLRLNVKVTVPYSAGLDTVRYALLTAVNKLDFIQQPEPSVVVDALGDNGVELILYAWVGKNDYFTAAPVLRETAKTALDAAGIAIPFPQIDVHTNPVTPTERTKQHENHRRGH